MENLSSYVQQLLTLVDSLLKQVRIHGYICKTIFDADVVDKIKNQKNQLVAERSSYKMAFSISKRWVKSIVKIYFKF